MTTRSIINQPSRADRLTGIVIDVLMQIVLSALNGAFTMWLLRLAHQADPRVPALGFVAAASICMALVFVVSSALTLHRARQQR